MEKQKAVVGVRAACTLAVCALGFSGSALAGDLSTSRSRLNLLEGDFFAPVFSAPLGDAAIYTAPGAPDQLYKYTWYYRTELDTSIRNLSSLTNPVVSYNGATATVNYPDTGPGIAGGGGRFDAGLTIQLIDGAQMGQTKVASTMTVTNRNTTRRTFRIYNLVDMDLAGGLPNSQGDDTLVLTSTNPIIARQTEASTSNFAEFAAEGATRFRIDLGFNLRTALNSSTITDFTNTPSVYTGDAAIGAEWILTLNPGESRVIKSSFAYNMRAVPPLCRADFNNSGATDIGDIFAFLSAWFARQASADFDQSGTWDPNDIFQFLTFWFQGCPT